MTNRSGCQRPSEAPDSQGSLEGSLVGAVIAGKYEIRRLLGTGAMGVVFEAVHLELHKRVALKLLRADAPPTHQALQRFRREARAASAVQSEHVVRIFDMGEDSRHGLFLAMELLHGEDLEARLARDVQLDVATSVAIARQTALGLAKLHDAGILHRDLKPANVFLVRGEHGEPEQVKLLDLGISKLLDGAPAARDALQLTRGGEIVGTPAYMSPEQALGRPLSPASDLYALGVILHEMLSGVRPHGFDSYERFIVRLCTQDVRPLKAVAPWVPAGLARVVDRMLERDAARRLDGARLFIGELDAAMAEHVADDEGRTLVADSLPFERTLEVAAASPEDDGPAAAGAALDAPDAGTPAASPSLTSGVRSIEDAGARGVETDRAEVFHRASLRHMLARPDPASGPTAPRASGGSMAGAPPTQTSPRLSLRRFLARSRAVSTPTLALAARVRRYPLALKLAVSLVALVLLAIAWAAR